MNSLKTIIEPYRDSYNQRKQNYQDEDIKLKSHYNPAETTSILITSNSSPSLLQNNPDYYVESKQYHLEESVAQQNFYSGLSPTLPLYRMDDFLIEKEKATNTVLNSSEKSNEYTLDICVNFKLELMKFNPYQRFIISAGIVLGMFIPYAWIQEYLMQSNSDRPANLGAFLTFSTFICWMIFSFVEGINENDWIQPKASMEKHVLLSLLSTISMSVSNIALQYVNYPTKVIFKTSKTIPVMFTGVIFFKKKYLVAEYLAAICLICGVVWFSYANMLVAPTWSIIGYVLMIAGLASDSICQNLNEKTIIEYECSEREMMFYTSTLGAFFLLAFLLFNDALWPCIEYFSLLDWFLVFFFSWLSFIGNKVLLTITKANGIFISLFLTSVRKLISILFSFLFFPKPFTFHYILGGLLAFFGIALNIWVQNRKAQQKKKNIFHHEKSSSI